MGVHHNIGFEKMPKQGSFLGKRVKVCFNYNSEQWIGGIIVRDDAEDPGIQIITLDDKRVLLTTECQYSLK